MTESLKIEEQSAERILKRTGDLSTSDARGQLFWLFQTIIHIAQKDLFEQNSSGRFKIKNWVGEIPVPDDMKESIRLQFEEHPEYKPVLECAACLGMEFQASLLSDSLKIDRIDLLRMLKNIDSSTGMINDVQDVDDLFRFQSSLVFEVIREQMAISGKGPQASDVPQIVREYHAMVANSLEKDTGSKKSMVFDIANHYYASGAKYAVKAYHYTREAAHASLSMYDFSKAEQYVDKAEDCAIFIDVDTDQLIEDRLVIKCHKAHITGSDETAAAQEGLRYFEGLDESSYQEKLKLLIKVTEACFNVGQEEWFHKTKDLAEIVIEHAEPDTIELAEGLHFKGLGMFPGSNYFEERLSIFNQAYEIVLNLPESKRRNRLFGKIMTTLGNEKTSRPSSVKEEGLELLERRLEFDEEKNINDLKGRAITLGSIGRYYHYNTSEIAMAEKHFKLDLDICYQIDDEEGESQMHSFLGECSIKNKNYKNAVECYQASYISCENMDDSGLNYRLFAHIGLLNSYSLMEKKDYDLKEIEEWGKRLNDLITTPLAKERKNELSGEMIDLKIRPIKDKSFSGMKNNQLSFIPLYDIVDNWAKVFDGDWLDQLKGQWDE